MANVMELLRKEIARVEKKRIHNRAVIERQKQQQRNRRHNTEIKVGKKLYEEDDES